MDDIYDYPAIAGAVRRSAELPTTSARDAKLLIELAELLEGTRLLTTSQVAELFGVKSSQTIRNWTAQGRFPHSVITAGGHRRFPFGEAVAVRDRRNLDRLERQFGITLTGASV